MLDDFGLIIGLVMILAGVSGLSLIFAIIYTDKRL